MELKLAKDEIIIKSWDYSSEGGMFKRDKLISTLTLTNKRIVSTIENKLTLNRDEVPLYAIKAVSATYGAHGKFWATVQAIIGGIFSLALIGIPILKSALKKLRSCSFDLFLETHYDGPEGYPFTIGAKSTAPKKKNILLRLLAVIPIIGIPFRSKKEKVIRVKKELAREIINEIGAAIMDLNN